MSDPLPEMFYVRSREAGQIVGVGETLCTDMGQVLAAVPQLTEEENLPHFARAVSHFAQGKSFELIEDPAAFETAYNEKLASEDDGVGWTQGVHRLRDFGVPDFSEITAPKADGDALTFFMRDTLTGLPYRVSATLDGAPLDDDSYQPLTLTAVSTPVRAATNTPKPAAPAAQD